MSYPPRFNKRNGTTLRNVVVAIFIIGLLLLTMVTVVHQSRVKNRRIVCESRQMQLARALLYYDMSTGSFPGFRDVRTVDNRGQPKAASWVFFTLPFLNDVSARGVDPTEDNFVYQEKKQRLEKEGLNSVTGQYAELFKQYGPEASQALRDQTPNVYIPGLVCPNNPRPNDTDRTTCWMSFVANTGMPDAEATMEFPADWPANGVFTNQFPAQLVLADRTSYADLLASDGPSATLMLTENVDSGLWTDLLESQVGFCWTADFAGKPATGDRVLRINQQIGQGNGTIRFARPSSYHEGGVNVAYCDGSTDFLSQDIDDSVYARLMTSDSANVRYPGTDKPVDPPSAAPLEKAEESAPSR